MCYPYVVGPPTRPLRSQTGRSKPVFLASQVCLSSERSDGMGDVWTSPKHGIHGRAQGALTGSGIDLR